MANVNSAVIKSLGFGKSHSAQGIAHGVKKEKEGWENLHRRFGYLGKRHRDSQ
jgi:hypothetical protein